MDRVPRITDRQDLVALAARLGMGSWREAVNEDVTASVHGARLNGVGFWPLEQVMSPSREEEAAEAGLPAYGIPDPRPTPSFAELYVTLYHQGETVGHVNLATLLGWASREAD